MRDALECTDEICAFEVLGWVSMYVWLEGGCFVIHWKRDKPSTRVSIGRVARPSS